MITSSLEALPEFITQDTVESGSVKYWGFANRYRKWYIARETVENGVLSIRVAAASNNTDYLHHQYHEVWPLRETLNYNYIYEITI